MESKAEKILAALGGKENIVSLDSCITRLRLSVKDVKLIDEKKLRALGAVGIMKMGSSVQVVLGTTAELIEQEIKKLL